MPAPYPIDQHIVLDASGDPVRGAEGQAYTLADPSFANPVAVTDPFGNPLTSLVSNSLALTPKILSPEKLLIWKSGIYTALLVSWKGIVEDVDAGLETIAGLKQDIDDIISGQDGGEGLPGSGGGTGSDWPGETVLGGLLRMATSAAQIRQYAEIVQLVIGTGPGQVPDATTVVTKTGDATVSGKVTFTQPPVLPAGALPPAAVAGLVAFMAGGAGDATRATSMGVVLQNVDLTWPSRPTGYPLVTWYARNGQDPTTAPGFVDGDIGSLIFP